MLKEHSGGRVWDLTTPLRSFLNNEIIYDDKGKEIPNPVFVDHEHWDDGVSEEDYAFTDGVDLEDAANNQRLKRYKSKDIARYIREIRASLANPDKPSVYGNKAAINAINRAGLAGRLTTEASMRIVGLDDLLLRSAIGRKLAGEMVEKIIESEK